MPTTRAGRREAELAQITNNLDTLGLLRDSGTVRASSLDLATIFQGRDMQSEETLELWGSIGTFLGRVHRSAKWWIADWLNFGAERFSEGERYAQMVDATGLTWDYLDNIARVGRQIAPSRRREGVPFSLHMEVAKLTPNEQTIWLSDAVEKNMTQRELRRAISAAGNGGIAQAELPGTEDDDEDRDPNRHVSPRRVTEIAWLMHRQARVVGDHVEIPVETYRQLEAALGEEN